MSDINCNNISNGAGMSKHAQIQSLPIQLVALINFLIDGVYISCKGLSNESIVLSQLATAAKFLKK